jgi:hypothetical protein
MLIFPMVYLGRIQILLIQQGIDHSHRHGHVIDRLVGPACRR